MHTAALLSELVRFICCMKVQRQEKNKEQIHCSDKPASIEGILYEGTTRHLVQSSHLTFYLSISQCIGARLGLALRKRVRAWKVYCLRKCYRQAICGYRRKIPADYYDNSVDD